MSEEIKLCRFCGAGEFHFDESNHWTGQRNVLLKVRLVHWCDCSDVKFWVENKTRELCIKAWNETFGKS